MLAPKIATIFLYSFTVCAMPLTGAVSSATGQSGRERNSSQPLEKAKRAEELMQEALALCETKEKELARSRLLEAMRLWMERREPEKAARAALQMGDCYKRNKKVQEILYYYKRALEVKPLSGSVKAAVFNSIAQVYAELYQYDLATRYYDKAIAEARIAKDISMQVAVLTGLADLHHRQGNNTKSDDFIEQAQKLNLRLGNIESEAALAHLEGLIDLEKGLTEKAGEAFDKSLATYQKIDSIENQVKVMCSVAELHLSSGRKLKALEQAERAVELIQKRAKPGVSNPDKLRARETLGTAWLSLARAQRALGRNKEAANSFFRALGQVEAMWLLTHISTNNSAVASRERLQAIYTEYIGILIEEGEVEEAYNWVSSARAKAIIGMIEARSRKGPRQKGDKEELLRELSRSIARKRTQLYSPRLGAAQRTRLQKDITEAEYDMEEARIEIEADGFRDRLVGFQPPTTKELQEELIPAKDAVLEFLLGEDRSFVWLVSSDRISFEILPGRKEIEKAVRQFTKVISTPPNTFYLEIALSRVREQAKALFSMLLGRLSEPLAQHRKIIVVPDGLLHYLPFEALIQNERYLVDDHEISYLSSASMLGLWQSFGAETEAENKMEFLAFGDPVFGVDSEAAGSKKFMSNAGDIVRQVRGSDDFHLPSLPWTRDEVQYIADLFPKDRRQVYLSKNSTEEAVKRTQLRRYRRLHFAAHGLIDEESPARSAIVLTLDSDPEEDGFLDVNEISELDLDCDLVVLSACQTGRGQLRSGEGIVGLSRAFLYAGAKSVMVSLWNVSDISTSRLMKDFYQHLANNGSNRDALRQAKLQMLQGDRATHHPYYWAPFVIVGKP